MSYKLEKQYRLPGYDYSKPGYYYITICTKDSESYLGQINKGIIYLSDIGKIADKFWREIPNHFRNTELDEYIVMPNHIHGIIQIVNPCGKNHNSGRNVPWHVPTNKSSIPTGIHPLQPQSLGSIINHYKGAVKKWCSNNHFEFAWQSRFYDHIVRDQESLERIREYIRSNPGNWDGDNNDVIYTSEIDLALILQKEQFPEIT